MPSTAHYLQELIDKVQLQNEMIYQLLRETNITTTNPRLLAEFNQRIG